MPLIRRKKHINSPANFNSQGSSNLSRRNKDKDQRTVPTEEIIRETLLQESLKITTLDPSYQDVVRRLQMFSPLQDCGSVPNEKTQPDS
jgi:hypothetical protein